MERSFGVRKGAWTSEEDKLLRKCIQKYGEGKWHQVPHRAGLNRCRKSCRLRWLNYHKPNIKRGEFMEDEVELMIKLHKLLGNRWSLIAGRLPGRTANDVKNYWNSRLRKKITSPMEEDSKSKTTKSQMVTRANIIKPRPRTFSKLLFNFEASSTGLVNGVQNLSDHGLQKPAAVVMPPHLENGGSRAGENLLSEVRSEVEKKSNDNGRGTTTTWPFEQERSIIPGLCDEEITPKTKGWEDFFDEGIISWGDLCFDVDI